MGLQRIRLLMNTLIQNLALIQSDGSLESEFSMRVGEEEEDVETCDGG